jgi:hypothetical protein
MYGSDGGGAVATVAPDSKPISINELENPLLTLESDSMGTAS